MLYNGRTPLYRIDYLIIISTHYITLSENGLIITSQQFLEHNALSLSLSLFTRQLLQC